GISIPMLWQLRIHKPLLNEVLEGLHIHSSLITHHSSLFYNHFQKFATATEAETKLLKWGKRLEKWKERVNAYSDKPLAKDVEPENLLRMLPKVDKAEKLLNNFIGKLSWNWWAKERP